MKTNQLISAMLCIIILFSCRKASTTKLDENVDAIAVLKYTGNFIGKGGQNVYGTAKIYYLNKIYQLKLENFSTSNGPDLKIYLSKSGRPDDFISLGDIQSTNGNQVYNIPGMPDFTVLRFVLIHCERYNHLYGTAELK